MKKSLIKLILALFLIFIPTSIHAETLNSINIEVDIDQEGLGHVTEIWDGYEDNEDATEKYKVLTDLDEIKIRDFKVSMNGKDFSEKNPWDIETSFEEKAYRYGVVNTENGVELCWGISEYGQNTYTLTYTIDPLVVSLNDYDMVFFRFIKENLSTPPEEITIKINGLEPFVEGVNDMWTFGFEGTKDYEDGAIVGRSTGFVDYAAVMIKIPKGTYNSSYHIDRDFEYYAEQAVVGSDWEVEETAGPYPEDGVYPEDGSFYEDAYSPFPSFRGIFFGAFAFIVGVIGLLAAGLGLNASGGSKIANIKDLNKEKDYRGQYYRDIPYEGPIEDTYLINQEAYGANAEVTNYINAFMLKWIYEGAISFGEIEEKKILRNVKTPYITIHHRPKNMAELERGFFDMVSGARQFSRDPDKILQTDVEKYMERNKSIVELYFERFYPHAQEKMIDGGYIKVEKIPKKFSFTGYKENLMFTDRGKDLYENFIKFKNYLKDYSLIEERGVNEVKIWDSYMIYAAIYGISQEVYENFKAIYPEYEQMSFYDPYTILWINNYASHIGRTYTQITKPDTSTFHNSGGGGFSSMGGGGGSFGGGSGGSGGGSR